MSGPLRLVVSAVGCACEKAFAHRLACFLFNFSCCVRVFDARALRARARVGFGGAVGMVKGFEARKHGAPWRVA